ncbi:MAG: NADH-quinone oxidoreductase subunit A [candidate division Zixibacteria bacterium]|nr:NADH-quinone oxidoreductase subunit A [candidate division Zixibacteria bacterium]
MFETFFPILFLIALAAVIAVVMASLSLIIGKKSTGKNRGEPYESGMVPKGGTKSQIPVKFYMVAILFIIFDIEVIFLYPWAVISDKLGMFGFIEMLVFVIILLVGYFYVLGKGALKWD